MGGKNQTVRLLPLLVTAACIKIIPPTPVPKREPVPIAAPYEAAWNATVEAFAVRHIQIQTLDKPSGLIVATPDTVESKNADRWASCGAIKHGIETPLKLHATDLEFNVVVRAAGTGSTIRINTRWTSRNPTDTERPDYMLCARTNLWETELETRIRTTAEGASGSTRVP
jgi:hypothetical protein